MIANRYQPLETAPPGAPIRARDQQTAQTVLLREFAVNDGAALDRANAAKGIFHPSLITLFDVTPLASGGVILAYEFVPAQPLRQLTGGQPFHPRRAAELMTEIADAAAELHAHGVVHGAISVETVLVTAKGKGKLDRVGDPSLARPDTVDEQADLVAIVAVLRELTKGARGTLPMLDEILSYDDGVACGSAATLAASLRAAAARPSE